MLLEPPRCHNMQPSYASACYEFLVRVRGCPRNGIFGPFARLLAGGCRAWRLLARRRHWRHSQDFSGGHSGQGSIIPGIT